MLYKIHRREADYSDREDNQENICVSKYKIHQTLDHGMDAPTMRAKSPIFAQRHKEQEQILPFNPRGPPESGSSANGIP